MISSVRWSLRSLSTPSSPIEARSDGISVSLSKAPLTYWKNASPGRTLLSTTGRLAPSEPDIVVMNTATPEAIHRGLMWGLRLQPPPLRVGLGDDTLVPRSY